MALLGHVGTLTHRGIVCWAWDSDAPDGPVPLMVTIGTRVLARCSADLYREDLAIEGRGLGRVGFELRLPPKLLSPRNGYEVSVRREGDGLHLPGSPYVLEAAVRVVRLKGRRIAAALRLPKIARGVRTT